MGFVDKDEQNMQILGIDMQGTPVWNVDEFFLKYMKDLSVGAPSVDEDSNFIIARLGQLVDEKTQFMISYQKKSYKS